MNPPRRTADALLHGRIALEQPAGGARVNLDAVLLAAFAATSGRAPDPGRPRFERAADLGAATGAVALLLVHGRIASRCDAFEVEPALAAILRRNVAANRDETSIDVRERDLRDAIPDGLRGRFDLVAANPPYLPIGTGFVSPDPLRAAARHEIRGGLPAFLRAAGDLLAPGGTLALVYRARRIAFARAEIARAGFREIRVRLHRPAPGSPPATFCAEARLDRVGDSAPATTPVEDLIVHEDGRYSAAVRRFLDGDYSSAS